MENLNLITPPKQGNLNIELGHLGIIFMAMVLLLGISWLEKPDLFSFNKQSAVADQNVPHYYAYVPSPQDLPQPEVLGASTNDGPQIIGDDGTVQPVDTGSVLGASLTDVSLSTDSVKVNMVPDSDDAIKNYFSSSDHVETSLLNDATFESALASNDQNQLNQEAQKFSQIRDKLLSLQVPVSLVHLQQLKVVQYNSAIALLQNFTQANSNPTLVSQYLEQFLKSQQDLDAENTAVAEKFKTLDPESVFYINSTSTTAGTVTPSLSSEGIASAILQSTSDLSGSNATVQDNSDNSDPSNASQ